MAFLPFRLGAQAAYDGAFCMDRDIRAMRANIFGDFYNPYGDYIQYAPGVVLYGVKACGYKTAYNWGRMLTANAFSALIMAGIGNGLKYSVNRTRPNGGEHSFPSGHSATSFMMAHWMHKELGWRSGWWSAGGYLVAVSTALQRLIVDRHWMSDTVGGALIGVGSVELGYFLSDLIFKDKLIYDGYEPLHIHYDSNEEKYYSIELFYSRRFVLGSKDERLDGTLPRRGSGIGLQAEIPVMPRSGVLLRTAAGSLVSASTASSGDTSLLPSVPGSNVPASSAGSGDSSLLSPVPDGETSPADGSYLAFNVYSGQAGMYWEYCFRHWLETEMYALIGYAGHNLGGGIDFTGGASLNIVTEEHFRFKGFAEWELMSYPSGRHNFMNSIHLGFSAGFYW
ncbi:MAG: phosphatase PAP2 family protein [Bacteroidales bacterium]|nr:phosphatase PAP2 family protein [Bacteroidales bacterium]